MTCCQWLEVKNKFFLVLENEPFSTNFTIQMSGIKRTLTTEDTNDNNELPITPNNSPDSKKLRHESSHSENEEETQLIDSENGIANGNHKSKYFNSNSYFL
jgi:hypothetical protein